MQKINLKVRYCYKFQIMKLVSSHLSLGVTGQTVFPARQPISAEFEHCNEPGGNKASLITTPKPSCCPQPSPRKSHWQPSHSWGQRHKILQPTLPFLLRTICEWTAKCCENRGYSFSRFFQALFAYIIVWRRIYLTEQEAYWGSCRQRVGKREIYKA